MLESATFQNLKNQPQSLDWYQVVQPNHQIWSVSPPASWSIQSEVIRVVGSLVVWVGGTGRLVGAERCPETARQRAHE